MKVPSIFYSKLWLVGLISISSSAQEHADCVFCDQMIHANILHAFHSQLVSLPNSAAAMSSNDEMELPNVEDSPWDFGESFIRAGHSTTVLKSFKNDYDYPAPVVAPVKGKAIVLRWCIVPDGTLIRGNKRKISNFIQAMDDYFKVA